MASKQGLSPQNKNYEKALTWYERQNTYRIDANIVGAYIEMKLYKNEKLMKDAVVQFDINYPKIIQEKILNLYEYENLQNATRRTGTA